MSARPMDVFVDDDGSRLRVVEGFRERVLSAPKVSVQPKPEWTADDYDRAAERKLRGSRRLLAELERRGGSLDGAGVLEVGCGPGIDCLLFALHPVERVVGIDLELPLHDPGERGERARRLTRTVLEKVGISEGIDETFRRLPVRLATMDATRMDFPDASVDLLISRAALEHVAPLERALAEIARVVRPGGLVRHAIDPFYWLRGCLKGGLIDIPWAHARLRPDALARFVEMSEGGEGAEAKPAPRGAQPARARAVARALRERAVRDPRLARGALRPRPAPASRSIPRCVRACSRA